MDLNQIRLKIGELHHLSISPYKAYKIKGSLEVNTLNKSGNNIFFCDTLVYNNILNPPTFEDPQKREILRFSVSMNLALKPKRTCLRV
jgi:hypothetical protein